MGYQIPASTSTANLGALASNTTAIPMGGIFCRQGLFIDTYANAMLKATWDTKTKINHPDRYLPTGACVRTTPQDVENTIMDSKFKGGKVVYWGKNSYIMEFDISVIAHAEWMKMNDRNDWALFPFDDNDNIRGVTSDGVKFEPRKCLTLQVLPRSTADESSQELTKVLVVLADTDYANRNPAIVNPTTWAPRDITPVHNVDITISGSWLATGGAFTVSYRETGAAVTGLVAADFAISGKVITSVTESSTVPGFYTLVSTGLVTSTLTMVACSSISLTTVKIENTTGMAFTIA